MKKMTAVLTVAMVLATGTFLFAGSPRGQVSSMIVVKANSSEYFTETLLANKRTKITIVGDGSTDVDIWVRDAAGQVVTKATAITDREWVTFNPTRTERYSIELRNLGNTWNRVAIVIDD